MSDKFDKVPNPGSNEALDAGCTCPVLDNAYGLGFSWTGYKEPSFWISENCPLHSTKAKEPA